MSNKIIVPRVSNFFGETIKLDDFEKVETEPLGEGSYGKVFLYRHKFTGKEYAIKEILLNRKQKKINRVQLQAMTKKEIQILYRIDNPHIVKLLDHFQSKDSIYLITQYLQGLNLYELCFKNDRKLSYEEIADIIYQVCLGLEELHSNHILHRDIKLENLMFHNGNIKIVDLGCSNFYGEHIQRKTKIGTILYYSPEILLHQEQNDRLDVWSLGVVFFQLIFGKQPFMEPEIEKKIRKIEINYSLFKMEPELKDLFEKIFVEKKSRIDIKHLKMHPWIKKYRKYQEIIGPQFQDFYTEYQASSYRQLLKENINQNNITLQSLRELSSQIEDELKEAQRQLKNKRKK